jgi:hypothetical protein
MQNPTHYIPIITSTISLIFTIVLFRRWRQKPGAIYLMWWTIGVLMFGVGTTTESLTTLFGWNPVVFKLWYICGALLGGAPLAQGTVYLMLRRKTAHILTVILVVFVGLASIFVILSPLNMTLVEPTRLSGSVLAWSWVRLFSPFVNTYALIFLVGGAAWSAWQYWKKGSSSRVLGNVLIAAGALLPGIGGSFTRLGYVEVLYVTELTGILLIWWGYHLMSSVAVTSIYAAQQQANQG